MQAPNTATHWLASSYGWNEASLEARPVQQVKEAAAASPQPRRAAAVCQVRAPAARAPRRCPALLGWWGPCPCGSLFAQQTPNWSLPGCRHSAVGHVCSPCLMPAAAQAYCTHDDAPIIKPHALAPPPPH